eukprot:gene1596-32985_t
MARKLSLGKWAIIVSFLAMGRYVEADGEEHQTAGSSRRLLPEESQEGDDLLHNVFDHRFSRRLLQEGYPGVDDLDKARQVVGLSRRLLQEESQVDDPLHDVFGRRFSRRFLQGGSKGGEDGGDDLDDAIERRLKSLISQDGSQGGDLLDDAGRHRLNRRLLQDATQAGQGTDVQIDDIIIRELANLNIFFTPRTLWLRVSKSATVLYQDEGALQMAYGKLLEDQQQLLIDTSIAVDATIRRAAEAAEVVEEVRNSGTGADGPSAAPAPAGGDAGGAGGAMGAGGTGDPGATFGLGRKLLTATKSLKPDGATLGLGRKLLTTTKSLKPDAGPGMGLNPGIFPESTEITGEEDPQIIASSDYWPAGTKDAFGAMLLHTM